MLKWLARLLFGKIPNPDPEAAHMDPTVNARNGSNTVVEGLESMVWNVAALRE